MKLKFQLRNDMDRHFKNGSSKYLQRTFISDQKQEQTNKQSKKDCCTDHKSNGKKKRTQKKRRKLKKVQSMQINA